ncbi:MAG: CBS domain-containing protein [Methanosarcinales archaeon Met12]|nr:MAG: CBS domain-containing protein [Methanosarcinales archaeon Met12]
MKVKDVMSSPVYVIAPEEPLSRARNLMLKHGVSRLVVVDGEIPVGIITKSDLMWKLGQAEPAWRRRPIDRVPVKVIMSEHLVTTYLEASLEDVSELMLGNDISGIPVVGIDGLVGIITKSNLVHHLSTVRLDIKVEDIMSDFVVMVHRHHSISHVIAEMDRNDVHRVIVMEGGNTPVGIITSSNLAFTELRDGKGKPPEKTIKMVRKESPAGRKKFRDVEVVHLVAEDVMSSPLITIGRDALVTDAAKILVAHKIDGVPVIDDEEMVGIVTKTDIIKLISGGLR